MALVNRSRKALTFQLLDSSEKGLDRLSDHGVVISPSFSVTLNPRETVSLDLCFAPHKRVLPFAEDVLVKYLGVSRKLLSVTGQCVGFDVALEADALNFGTVCLGSSKTKRLQISNSGEMASRFRWEPKTFGPHIK